MPRMPSASSALSCFETMIRRAIVNRIVIAVLYHITESLIVYGHEHRALIGTILHCFGRYGNRSAC